MSNKPSNRLKVRRRGGGRGGVDDKEEKNNTNPEQNTSHTSSFNNVQPCATSSPVNIHRRNVTYAILPHENSVIEDTDDWNADKVFSEVCRQCIKNELISKIILPFVSFSCRVSN